MNNCNISIKDQVILKVAENSEVVLSLSEPVSRGSYEEITWYKDQTGNSNCRIVFVNPTATGGEPWYNNEFCSGSSPCETSSKGELNVSNGNLTIHSTNLFDEGFYYYNFYSEEGTLNTGHKYEIYVEVYGKLTIN